MMPIERKDYDVIGGEEHYRTLFNAIGDAVFVHELREDGPPGRFLEVNSVACERLGYTRDELLKMSPVDIDARDTEVDVKSIGLRVLAGESVIFEQVHLDKNGRRIPVEIRVQKFNVQGRVCVLSLVRDMTERKLAEAALRESETKFQTFIEASPMPMGVVDGKGNITYLNKAFTVASSIGYTKADIPNFDEWTSRAYPDPQYRQSIIDIWHHNLEEARQNNKPFVPIEVNITCKNGLVRTFLISAESLKDGFAGHVLAIFYDITERKLALDALRDAEEQFRGLVEQSITGIYIIQDEKFAYVNPHFAEIFAYNSAGDLIGSDPILTVHEKDRSTVVKNLQRRLEGKEANIAYEFTALRKDGSMIDVGVQGSSATYRGRPAVIGILQDISDKKRAQEEIQHYIGQLKTAFMSTVKVATTLSEMRDPYTTGHERRVAEIAVAIGVELGFDLDRLEGLRVAGHLHDVGKITIPSEILSKPGLLSAIEFQLVQKHAQAGYDVLEAVEWPWPVAQVALQHHERFDGSGYPQGLKGEAILLESRIMAVADVVEAISSHRPYRPGLGIEAALAEIERGCGTLYDPVVAGNCLRMFREKGFVLPA